MSRNQAQVGPPTLLIEDFIENSASFSKTGLSSLLTCDFLAPTNISKPISALATLTSTKELFKLFMQAYIDTVKK